MKHLHHWVSAWLGVALSVGTVSVVPAAERQPLERTVVLAGVMEQDYDVALAKELLKRAGYVVEFREQPWARCLASMRSGSVDLLANVFVTEERKEFLHYGSEPLFAFKQFLYVEKGSAIRFDGNLEALQDYRIGTRHGFSYGTRFDALISRKTFNLQPVRDPIQNIQKLRLGRLDMFVESPMNLILELKQQEKLGLLEELHMLRPPISQQPSYLTLSRKSRFGPDLLGELDRQLRSMKSDGAFEAILKQYFGEYPLE